MTAPAYAKDFAITGFQQRPDGRTPLLLVGDNVTHTTLCIDIEALIIERLIESRAKFENGDTPGRGGE